MELPLIIPKYNGLDFKNSTNITKIKEGTANGKNFFLHFLILFIYFTLLTMLQLLNRPNTVSIHCHNTTATNKY